ncbi:phosphotransferase family protein [Methylorubrum thiocyanatum]|uniref:phosphotransferase family protein n=1 Tax=Methylorubrum thiocyanatum TaxID=47958 RepID=UPI00383BBCE9
MILPADPASDGLFGHGTPRWSGEVGTADEVPGLPRSTAATLSLDDLVGLGRSSEVFRYGRGHVLKLYRTPGCPSAVMAEFRASSLAHALGLPVPRPISVLEREGRTGILFEYVQGGTMLDACRRRPLDTFRQLGRLARLQHAVNACEGACLPDQHEALRLQVEGARVPSWVRQAALVTLARLPGGQSLCHGDMHPENVICTPGGPRVLDWQKATIGNPAGDVARTALLLRYGRIDLGRLARYLPVDTARAALAWFYVDCRRQLGGPAREEVAAWRLPLLVARLYGQPAPNEAEVLAAAERLASRA